MKKITLYTTLFLFITLSIVSFLIYSNWAQTKSDTYSELTVPAQEKTTAKANAVDTAKVKAVTKKSTASIQKKKRYKKYSKPVKRSKVGWRPTR